MELGVSVGFISFLVKRGVLVKPSSGPGNSLKLGTEKQATGRQTKPKPALNYHKLFFFVVVVLNPFKQSHLYWSKFS